MREGFNPFAILYSGQKKFKKLYDLTTTVYVFRMLRFIWETNPKYSLAVIILRFFRAISPILTLFLGKLIIDKLVAIKAGTSLTNELWPIVILEVIVVSLSEIAVRVSALIESLLSDLLTNRTSICLMEKAIGLNLSHFEDPTFYDKLERAKKHLFVRIAIFTNLLTLIQDSFILVSIAVGTLVYNVWLFILLFLSTVPSLLSVTHFASLEYSMLFHWTKEQRLLEYLMELTTKDKTAKEIQSFSLGEWLVERFKKLSKDFYQENKQLAVRKNLTAIIFTIVGIVGYYLAFVFILKQTLTGTLSLGTMTFLSLCFLRSKENLQRVLTSIGEIYSQSLYLKDFFDFLEIQPSITSNKQAIKIPQPLVKGIVFEDVSFSYPGSQDWAVNNLNFHISPGESLAIVGENGAGKTTIAKLLLRLYDPTKGRILLDGVDLRSYDLFSLRNAVSAIFQDFLHYDLSFNENIAVGDIHLSKPHLEDESNSFLDKNVFLNRLDSAMEKSLANSILEHLPNKGSQILGRRFEDGVDLSGGEWQKIAIARLHMKETQVVILDEPTSALDARAEYEVSKEFSKMMADRITIIISHRFSTIRMAKKIIVLEKGIVIEQGTHEELLKQVGLYSELFKIQTSCN